MDGIEKEEQSLLGMTRTGQAQGQLGGFTEFEVDPAGSEWM